MEHVILQAERAVSSAIEEGAYTIGAGAFQCMDDGKASGGRPGDSQLPLERAPSPPRPRDASDLVHEATLLAMLAPGAVPPRSRNIEMFRCSDRDRA